MTERLTANVAELVEARSNMLLTQDKLTAAVADVKKWKITFDVDVQPVDDAFNVTIVASANGKVVKQTLTQEEVLHLMVDTDDISRSISTECIAALLLEPAFLELTPKLSQAFKNVKMLAQKKGFAK